MSLSAQVAAVGTKAIRRVTRRGADHSSVQFPVLEGGPFEQVATDLGPLWMMTSDEVMRPYMVQRGRWNETTADLLRTLIQPGCRFLDVGANAGYFSIFAHRVEDNVTVDSVEPHPDIHALLAVNLWANSVPARQWKVALGDQRRMLPMSSAPHNPGDTRLGQLRADERYDLVVPVVQGDELFAGRSFDVVKIGVQGFEPEVVLGLQRVVRQSAGIVLVLEFWPAALRDRGLKPEDVVLGYASMGFDIAVHDSWGIGNCAVSEVVAHCDSAGPNGQVNLILRPQR
jgi:FkbM family methyltransferase